MNKFTFTVEETFTVTDMRYKTYIKDESTPLPTNWGALSVDEKYTWVNENCDFRSDHADEVEKELIDEVAIDMENS